MRTAAAAAVLLMLATTANAAGVFQTTIGTRVKGPTNQTERVSFYSSYYLTGTGQGTLRVAKRILGSNAAWDYFFIKTGIEPAANQLQIYARGDIPQFRTDFAEEWLFELEQGGKYYRKIQKPIGSPWTNE